MQTKKETIAVVAGATGLVGRQILHLLAQDERIAEVRALTRRPLPPEDKLPRVRECIADFDRLESQADWLKADIVFSALGATIRKAGSQKAFRRVDFDYPLAIAKAARAAGSRHFLFVSALGANSRSFFFYNRVKGELEEAVLGLGYPSVTIARPSLLLGERIEHRFGEEIAKPFARLFPGPWAPVYASQVASALVHAAFAGKPGVEILDNKRLRLSSAEKKEI